MRAGGTVSEITFGVIVSAILPSDESPARNSERRIGGQQYAARCHDGGLTVVLVVRQGPGKRRGDFPAADLRRGLRPLFADRGVKCGFLCGKPHAADNATNLERKSGERAAPVRRAGFACVVLFDSRTSQNDSARHRICRQQFFRSMPSATTVPFLRRSVAPRRTLIHDEAPQWGQSCLREVQEPPKQ